jgi:hypothetical protein
LTIGKEHDIKVIYMQRSDSVVARTAGAIKTTEPALDAQELREAAAEAIAEEAAERMGG